MLIIDTRDSDTIDRALKKYKKKFEKSGVLREIRSRREYRKPSVQKRTTLLKAKYRQKMVNSGKFS